jgi:tetratricopeptide (TPR) repeat protein
MPYENNKSFYLCKRPKFDLKEYWLIVRSINPRFLEILSVNSVQAAIDYYHQSVEKNPRIPLFTERQINVLGYEYLFNGHIDEAIALFKLNVDVFPESSNVYDSLGEGYMKNGQYELAIINFNRSLEINPNNQNAREKLKKLEILKKS